jgi:3-hydroxyacyl-[acyl-carrier-protein] dehydratase
MLHGDFFTISKKQQLEDASYYLLVEVNPKHKIFDGHFPQNPIVPGVCLTQMVKEIIEFITHKSYDMTKADNIKFTAIVNPDENPQLETKLALKELETRVIQAELSFFAGETTFYKFKGSFTSKV